MNKEVTVFLESESYYPGQRINGKVVCNFSVDTKVQAIRVRFKGRSKVQWHEQRYTTYYADETYFEMVSDLLVCETVFPPGQNAYPFTFELPTGIPPSMNHEHGNIRYTVLATVDRPWAIDYIDRKEFKICSYIDLNCVDDIKQAVELMKKKSPFCVFGERGLITLTVRLPATGFVPGQMVAFTAVVKNNSRTSVQEVRFNLVQGFKFIAELNMRTEDVVRGQTFAVVDGSVAPGDEKSWDLELRVPANTYNGSLDNCKIIKSYVELRGELKLPIPHRNLTMEIPLLVGNVPLGGLS